MYFKRLLTSTLENLFSRDPTFLFCPNWDPLWEQGDLEKNLIKETYKSLKINSCCFFLYFKSLFEKERERREREKREEKRERKSLKIKCCCFFVYFKSLLRISSAETQLRVLINKKQY